MKSFYGMTLGERVYLHYPDEVLANIANDFLKVFEQANFRKKRVSSALNGDYFSSEVLGGNDCVQASPGQISIDFSRAGIQGWAHSQVFDAETVIDELFKRAEAQGVAYNNDIRLAYDLKSEVSDFIDKYCIPAALNVGDMIYNSCETVKALRL